MMTGSCEHCGASFEVALIHNGFNDSSYAYCSNCGKTAILSGWSKNWPNGVKCTQAEIAPEMGQYLLACECGGKFFKGSSPRCPKCGQVLSADGATIYIEGQSPGTQKGWRWQRNWQGIYCVVINGHRVVDNFRA
jgi:hypothetical protein